MNCGDVLADLGRQGTEPVFVVKTEQTHKKAAT